ncbi:MAG TPA: hypothetical protein VL068_13815 [Microthrixaceae bacterium]|nr:hypothetical protein [Microthrixaceae bacterium]
MPILLMSIVVVALACAKAEAPKPAFTGDISKGNPTVEAPASSKASGTAPEPVELDAASMARLQTELGQSGEGCEVLSTRSCLLPFPSDAYTVADNSTGTGRRVDLPEGLLANAGGSTLDPTEWNRNDGFSPSSPILVQIPGMDPAKTKLPAEDNIGLSLTSESATVIVNLDTGQLVPHWAEMDSHATTAADQVLILRPAISLPETNRFAVAIRDVKAADGSAVESPLSFRVLRDNNPTTLPQIESRRAQFEAIFASLATAGVNRADLYVSWHFTVASADSLAGRVLSMRDDSMGRLNGQAPKFKVTETETDDLQPGIAKVVKGTFEVPVYLDGGGVPGSRMTFDPQSKQPVSNGNYTANFVCSVPVEAVESGEATPVIYGHGLLGSAGEAASSQAQHTAAENNSLYCATNWIGMSEEDISNAVAALGDISKFPSVADRLQQSLINTLYLGRLMIHEDGLGSDPAFETTAGANMINTASAYFDGNSQGGIMGGAVTAIAQDWTKASLGVTGMNYSTLLNRSVDFDEYAVVLRNAYPNTLDQQMAFGLLQMLWDRGETSGYVQHLTDRPYDLTPAHQVILTVAYGDHQVAPITAENIARTLRIPIYQPTLAADRMPKGDMFWNLSPIRKFPLDGSALYFWDSGTLAPPLGNITPAMSDAFKSQCAGQEDSDVPPCADPHEDPRRQPEVIAQKKAFFVHEGKITNVCHKRPCKSEPRSDFDY